MVFNCFTFFKSVQNKIKHPNGTIIIANIILKLKKKNSILNAVYIFLINLRWFKSKNVIENGNIVKIILDIDVYKIILSILLNILS